MNIQNPFLITKKFGSNKHYFGKSETISIIELLTSGENVFVISSNELVKTDLIENVFYQLNKQKITTIYFDLKSKTKLKFLLVYLVEKLGNKNYSNYSLKDLTVKVLELLTARKNKCIIAIDNMQFAEKELIDYLETEFLANSVSLILASSEEINIGIKNHLIRFNFDSEIGLKKYILKNFSKGKIKVSKKAATKIIYWSDFDFYTIKLVCSRLWSLNKQKITKNDLEFVISNLLHEYERMFLFLKNVLSEYQWKLLKAIAVDPDSVQITSANFIKKYDLNAPSSVKTAVTALQQKGLIVKTNKSYKVNNIILAHWLEKIE